MRGLSRFWVLVPVLVLLVSCSPNGKSGNSSVKQGKQDQSLVIWGMGVEGERLKDIVKFYEEENPNSKITIQSIPWGQAHEKLVTALAAEMTPDLCQMGTTWIPEFVTLDALESLDYFIDNSKVLAAKNYFAGSWQTGNIEGSMYGIPWYVDTRVLFYRTDVLQSIGYDHAPATWDELKDACMKLTKKDAKGEYVRRGITLPPADWMVLCMFLWSNGGEVMDDKNNVLINSPENREALDFYTGFFKNGCASRDIKGGVSLYNDFKSGFVPMFIGGSWMMEDIQKHVPEVEGKWSVAVLPKKKAGTSFVGGSNWCIFKDSKQKEEAWKFIEFLSRPDIQVKWYQLTTDLPTRTEAWDDEFFADKPKVKIFSQQLLDVKTPPRIQKWEEMTVKINEHMENAVFGKESAAEAMTMMEKAIKEILARSR